MSVWKLLKQCKAHKKSDICMKRVICLNKIKHNWGHLHRETCIIKARFLYFSPNLSTQMNVSKYNANPTNPKYPWDQLKWSVYWAFQLSESFYSCWICTVIWRPRSRCLLLAENDTLKRKLLTTPDARFLKIQLKRKYEGSHWFRIDLYSKDLISPLSLGHLLKATSTTCNIWFNNGTLTHWHYIPQTGSTGILSIV